MVIRCPDNYRDGESANRNKTSELNKKQVESVISQRFSD